MCGIIVDMTIINILIRNYFPQLIPFLDNKEENYGDYIGNNFINVNLINIFTNEYINENTSLLILNIYFDQLYFHAAFCLQQYPDVY